MQLLCSVRKKIPIHAQNKLHSFGEFYLSKNSFEMILPLLKKQSYLNSVEKFKN